MSVGRSFTIRINPMIEYYTQPSAPIVAQSDMYTVYGGPDGAVSIDIRGYDQKPLLLRSELMQEKFRIAQTPEEIHQRVIFCVLLTLERKYGREKAMEMMTTPALPEED